MICCDILEKLKNKNNDITKYYLMSQIINKNTTIVVTVIVEYSDTLT